MRGFWHTGEGLEVDEEGGGRMSCGWRSALSHPNRGGEEEGPIAS